jgi:hypothetical protein
MESIEPMRKRRLGAEQRRALAMLAGAAPNGCPKAVLIMHGLTSRALEALLGDGLAKAQSETVRAGGRSIEATRLRITDAGRRALAE